MKRAAWLLSFFMGMLLSACGGDSLGQYHRFAGETMGTTYHVVARVPARVSQQQLELVVAQALDRVNQAMSTYRPDSELSQLNRFEQNQPFPASSELYVLLETAQQISEATAGAYDVTVGPLVNAWGFGPDYVVEAPSAEVLAQLHERVGYHKLLLDQGRVVRTADLYVDLSSIAKGYGVDQAALALSQLQVTDYLVEVGGELKTLGVSPRGDAWRVAIENPEPSNEHGVHRALPLTRGEAVATSGDYRNYIEKDGRRFSHTIDPRTGYPIKHGTASVTVVADNCRDADGWATALSVLPPDEAMAVAERKGIAAYFIVRENDQFVTRYSAPFAPYLAEEPVQ